jgi:hypothetical protein
MPKSNSRGCLDNRRISAMKQYAASVLALILLCSPAYARLGEDETTISHRYGEPVGREEVAEHDKKLLYHDTPYNLAITFLEGRAVIISYRLESGERMSLWRIEHILNDNAKKENGWKSIWFLADKPCVPGEISFINEQQNGTGVYNLENETLTVRYKGITGSSAEPATGGSSRPVQEY